MPSATIDGPEIEDVHTKRVLVKEMTDALEKAYRLPREAYHVIIRENSPENVGVGGILVLDKMGKIRANKALDTFVAQQKYSNPLVGVIVFIVKGGKWLYSTGMECGNFRRDFHAVMNIWKMQFNERCPIIMWMVNQKLIPVCYCLVGSTEKMSISLITSFLPE